MHTAQPDTTRPDTTTTRPETARPETARPHLAPAESTRPEATRPHLAPVGDEGQVPQLDDERDLPTRLVVRPWFDPGLALRGVDPRSDYVERFWTGIVGPSVVMLSRRLARGLDQHPAGFSMAPADTARAIGLSGGLGHNAPMARTVDRACMFGLMRRSAPEQLEVRTHVPLLTARQLRRLPLAVRASHEQWLTEQRSDRPPAA